MNSVLLVLVALLSGPAPEPTFAKDAIVAQVTGPRGPIVVTAARLHAFVAARPGTSVETALQDLVDFELLAAEAAVGNIALDREVGHARAQAMVTRYLIDVFEAQWSAEALPLDEVRQAYERVKRNFVHPELRDANHILVSVKQKRPEDEALDGRAQALSQKIHDAIAADPPRDGEAFLTRAAPFVAEAKAAGLDVDAQALRRFAFKGRYAPAFTAPVFGMEKAGDLLGPFSTRFGYHVVWLNEIIPPRNDDFEAAEVELRTRFAPVVRKRELRRLTDRLAGTFPPITKAPGVYALMNLFPLQAVALRRGVPEAQNP